MLHALTLSRSHESSDARRAIALVLMLLFFCAGCDLAETTASDSQIQQLSDRGEIDAGVIFSGRATSYCVPLSRIGLSGYRVPTKLNRWIHHANVSSRHWFVIP